MKGLQGEVHGALRAFPFILSFSFFSAGIIFQSPLLLFYGIANFMENILNTLILKPFFKRVVYQNNGERELPIIGRGNRPDGARFCGSFIIPCNSDDEECGVSKSFGMPSGHAQISTSFAIFWTLYILTYLTHTNKLLSLGYIWLISFLVSYSRIYFGCHTKEQVIIGNVIGLITGAMTYIAYSRLVR